LTAQELDAICWTQATWSNTDLVSHVVLEFPVTSILLERWVSHSRTHEWDDEKTVPAHSGEQAVLKGLVFRQWSAATQKCLPELLAFPSFLSLLAQQASRSDFVELHQSELLIPILKALRLGIIPVASSYHLIATCLVSHVNAVQVFVHAFTREPLPPTVSALDMAPFLSHPNRDIRTAAICAIGRLRDAAQTGSVDRSTEHVPPPDHIQHSPPR